MEEVGKRPRWGRPPVERAHARSERVVTFLTPDERALLDAYADDLGQSISATAHHLICKAMDRKGETHKRLAQTTDLKGSNS
ncbi:MAG: hypothetical protein AAF965_07430 [Pseudomonadota bacterium]